MLLLVRAQQNEENRYMQQIKLDNDVGKRVSDGKIVWEIEPRADSRRLSNENGKMRKIAKQNSLQ